MAKFFEVSDDTQELFDKMVNDKGLVHYMNLKCLGTSKSKKLIEVKRCPPLGEQIAKKDSVVCVIIFEEAFDRLSDEIKEVLLDDALSTIRYDDEKDKIIIGAPSITVTVGGRQKHGDLLVNYAETAVLVMQQIEDEKKEEKERQKAERAAKRKNNG